MNFVIPSSDITRCAGWHPTRQRKGVRSLRPRFLFRFLFVNEHAATPVRIGQMEHHFVMGITSTAVTLPTDMLPPPIAIRLESFHGSMR